MKKIFFAAFAILSSFALTSCDEDYNEGLMPPMSSPAETPQTVAFGNGAVTEVATINLAYVKTDVVKLCNITAPTVSDPDATLVGYTLTIGDNVLEMSEAGEVSVEEITAIVEGLYGKRPVERTVQGVVRCYYAKDGQNVVTVSDPFKIKLIPQAPEIEQAYYFTGSINGWNNTDTTYKLTNDGSDPYENPVFTLRIPAAEDGSNIEFKMTPESGLGGDWSKCLTAGEGDGKFAYNNAGSNLVITAVEGAVYYDLVFNMLDQTWTATALLIDIEPAYYFTGSINDWDNTDTTYKLTNDGSDPYANPTFTCRIPAPEDGSNIEFKMTPESGLGGDWSKCLAGGATEGTFVYNNGGGNLVITAVEGAKYYDLPFNMLELTWSYKAVAFNPYIYFIGATDGWANAEQKLALTDESGIYTGYVYCADPNGWGNEFKFQRVAGSWDNEINSGTFTGGITGDFADGGGNIKANAGEGVYFVTADLASLTLSAVRITNMNLVGDFNGWNAGDDAQQMTWDEQNYCYVITGAAVTANGWKFTTNNSWDINLGGTVSNLVANGDNLSVVGSTIKLYPTRKGSDNIYCTVE